jgi:hypothetical protein
MSVIEEIKEKVKQKVSETRLSDDRAFGYWFLEEFEELSQEDAEGAITDGAGDGGRDAVIVETEDDVLKLYQFKFSQDKNYVLTGFSDLERGVKREEEHLRSAKELQLYLVTILRGDEDVHLRQKMTKTNIKRWLTQHGFAVENVELEVYDLVKFMQEYETLFGVNIDGLDFLLPPLMVTKSGGQQLAVGDGLIGLMDARKISDYADEDELFAFNIRRFLGLRKGSVNSKITKTLEDEEKRRELWLYNNGIVCLCTKCEKISDCRFQLSNFTIVNGAQTINTIHRFVLAHQAVEDKLWVLGKIAIVEENEIDRARKLTETSNTQTPASNLDLRSIDISHQRLETWFRETMGVSYQYKRGQRIARGADVAKMKELAQAYVAFWTEKPHIAFGRVAKIFEDATYYEDVFPPEDIETLRTSASRDDVRRFLWKRLIPYRMLFGIRSYLNAEVEGGTDKKYKSLAYHTLWCYNYILNSMGFSDITDIVENRNDEAVNKLLQDILSRDILSHIYGELKSFCDYKNYDIPKKLKVESTVDEIRSSSTFLDSERIKDAKTKLATVLATSI